jgi:hypothetical protein
MISAIKNRLWFLSALLAGLSTALAQAPSGNVSFAFDRSTFPLWDFSGAYQFNQEVAGLSGPQPLAFSLSITHELDGALHGSGTTMVTVGQNVLAATYVLEGAVRLSGNATRVAFTVTLSGDGLDIIAGKPRLYGLSLAYNLVVNPDLLAWVPPEHGAPVSGRLSIAGLGSAKVIPGEAFAVTLPPGVDGSWAVILAITALGQLGGTAAIVIDSSAEPDRAAYLPGTLTLNASLAGAYRPSLGTRVQVTGLPGSSPAALQLTLNDQVQLVRMTGRVLGQTVNWLPAVGVVEASSSVR